MGDWIQNGVVVGALCSSSGGTGSPVVFKSNYFDEHVRATTFREDGRVRSLRVSSSPRNCSRLRRRRLAGAAVAVARNCN